MQVIELGQGDRNLPECGTRRTCATSALEGTLLYYHDIFLISSHPVTTNTVPLSLFISFYVFTCAKLHSARQYPQSVSRHPGQSVEDDPQPSLSRVTPLQSQSSASSATHPRCRVEWL